MRLGMLAVAGGLVAASVASGAVIGSPAIDRNLVDGAYQITFIDAASASPIAGNVVSWEMFAEKAGSVTLQVWRPVSAGSYQLIGSNPVTATGAGAVVFDIAPENQIPVQAGDLIGFRYYESSEADRVISFDQFAGGNVIFTDWPRPDLDVPVGGTLTTTFVSNESRVYSLNATVAVPEAGGLAAALPLAAMLRRRRALTPTASL